MSDCLIEIGANKQRDSNGIDGYCSMSVNFEIFKAKRHV